MAGAWRLSLLAAAAGLLRGGEAMRPEEAARQPDFAAELRKIGDLLPKDRSQLGAMKSPASHKKMQALGMILPLVGALQEKAQHHAPVEQPKVLAEQHHVAAASTHARASGAPPAPAPPDFLGEMARLTGVIATIAAKRKGVAPAAPAADAAAPAQAAASGASEAVKALSGLMGTIAGGAAPGASIEELDHEVGALQEKAQQHAPVERHALAPASDALEQPKVLAEQHVSAASTHAAASGAPPAPPPPDFVGEIAKLGDLLATIVAKKKGVA